MADFETQVKALTGITLGGATTPINTDLDQFLVDGVLEVTNKWLALRPGDRTAFTRKWESGISGTEKVAAGTYIQNSDFSQEVHNWVVYESSDAADTEKITAANDRTFGGASNWTNGTGSYHAWDSYDETTDGVLTLNSDADGANKQTAWLEGDASGLDGSSGQFRLTYDINITSYSGAGSGLDIGTMTDGGAVQDYNRYTAVTSGWVYGEEIEFTYDSNCERLGIIANTNTDVTVLIDNVSLKPITATHADRTGNSLKVDPGGNGTYEGVELPATNIYPTGGTPWTVGSLYRMTAKMRSFGAAADAGPITFELGGTAVIPTNITNGSGTGLLAYNEGNLHTYQADIIATTNNGNARIYIASPSDSDEFLIDDVTIEELNLSPQLTSTNLISVQRESGTNGDWRECRTVPIGLQSRITDASSLYYASKYSPAYTLDEMGNIKIFPITDDSTGNKYQVYYVNNSPVANDLTVLVRTDSDIQFFPDDKVHLVIKYAAMQVLISAFTALVSDVDTIPNIMIDHDGDDSFAEAESTSTQDLTKFNVNSWSAVDYDFDSQNLDVTRWFQVAGDMIQRQEDIDLANAQMTKIQQYLSAYQATAEVKTQRIQARMKDYIQRYDWIAGSYNDYFRTEAEMQSRQDKQREQAQERRSE
tara:strand:+ start:6219 stop:8165 length:1947 start_codon:yes stop_codon:yes gene_type:complete